MLYLCRCNPFNGIPTMVHEPNSKFNRNVRKYNCRTTNRVKMTRLITIEQLLAKPICMMTGEELTLLLQNTEKVTAKVPAEVVPEKHYEYGIEGLAKVFKCSIPTANRIKKSGVIDAAITQVGRKIVVDLSSLLNWQRRQVALLQWRSDMDETWKKLLIAALQHGKNNCLTYLHMEMNGNFHFMSFWAAFQKFWEYLICWSWTFRKVFCLILLYLVQFIQDFHN